MSAQSISAGGIGRYHLDEESGRLYELERGLVWLPFEPDAPPDRAQLPASRPDDAMAHHFRTEYDPSGLRADPTEGAGFEHVEEPTQWWNMSCFVDGVAVRWQGMFDARDLHVGRCRRDGDRVVIHFGDASEPLPPADAVKSKWQPGSSPDMRGNAAPVVGTLTQGDDGRTSLSWAGFHWVGKPL